MARLSSDELIACLPDPDDIGQSEYRAIYELLSDSMSGYEPDCGSPAEFVEAILDEVGHNITDIRMTIRRQERNVA